jgi:2,4-didehydro-3-deoxy-L-rhamnonate hydrolase
MRSPNRIALALVVLTAPLAACAAPYAPTDTNEVSGASVSAGSQPTAPAAAGKNAAAPISPAAASTSEAVSLARLVIDGKVHTLGVKSYDGKAIVAVDLSNVFGEYPSYPLDLVTKHGMAAIAGAIDTKPTIPVDVAKLAAPVDETTGHIATALNYPEHQTEAGSTGPTTPYLFPKIARATASVSTVDRRAGDLLDYEVEMCAVFGGDIASITDLPKQLYGLMVCNDISDRAAQVMGADPLEPELAEGFTDAKSREGFFPLGPFVVVPKDGPAFAAKRTLDLSLNAGARQHDETKSMVWNIETIVAKALAVGSEPRFTLAGKPVALLPTGKITKGQILVTGTPGGVIFRAPTQKYQAAKIAEYIAKGGPLTTGTDPLTYVKAEYVEELQASGTFMKPGDAVDCQIDMLGSMHITIAGVK